MQPSTSQDAFSQLTAFQKSRRNPNDILQESQTRLGLPSAEQRKVGLRGAISNTENLLKGVDPSVTGRTAGTFTSEAQRNRLVQLERAPLADQFTEQSRALEGETANVADLNARALTEAQLASSTQDKQESDLKGIYDILLAREQQAEEKRRYEEEQRIAREAQAAALRASQQQGDYLSNLFKTNNPATTATQKTLRQTWQEEANKGDYNAQVALNYVGDDGRYDGPVNSARELNILKSMGIKGNYFLNTVPTGGLSTSSKSSNGLSVLGGGAIPTILNSKGLTARL